MSRANERGEAEKRLEAHGRDLAREVSKRSRYGQYVLDAYRESRRQEDPAVHERVVAQELRALTTGGGGTVSATSGASSFVPPAYLLDQIVTYRTPYRAVADAVASVPLPSYGMSIVVPAFTGAGAAAAQTEGSAVADDTSSITASYLSSPIVTKAAQVQVSRQFSDRVGPGIEGDAIILRQLKELLDSQVSSYVIAQMLADSRLQTVSNAGATFALTGTSAGVNGFAKDVRAAKKSLTDLAGTRIRATHLFAPSDLIDYVLAWNDGSGRPLADPAFDDNRLPIRAVDDPDGQGYSGYVFQGLAMAADDSIPASGSNFQVLVARADTTILAESVPFLRTVPQALAGSLDDVLIADSYVAAVPRYPVAAITGAFYAATQF